MTHESHPAGREPLAKDVYSREVDYSEADSQPLLDETGNKVKDQKGNTVHGEPAH